MVIYATDYNSMVPPVSSLLCPLPSSSLRGFSTPCFVLELELCGVTLICFLSHTTPCLSFSSPIASTLCYTLNTTTLILILVTVPTSCQFYPKTFPSTPPAEFFLLFKYSHKCFLFRIYPSVIYPTFIKFFITLIKICYFSWIQICFIVLSQKQRPSLPPCCVPSPQNCILGTAISWKAMFYHFSHQTIMQS